MRVLLAEKYAVFWKWLSVRVLQKMLLRANLRTVFGLLTNIARDKRLKKSMCKQKRRFRDNVSVQGFLAKNEMKHMLFPVSHRISGLILVEA